MDNQPPADEWNETEEKSRAAADQAAESLSQIAGALARVSQ